MTTINCARIPAFSIAAGLLLAIAVLDPVYSFGQENRKGVSIIDQGDKVRIEVGGKFFSEYHYGKYDGKDVPRPFFYPVIGPGDAPMTRNWPMKEGKDEAKDHPHHRSLWYAHGAINDHDFWSESPSAGTTVHEKFLALKSGNDKGVIQSKNKLVAKDGTIVCTDERTMTIYNLASDRMIDFEITIRASHGDVTFGDTKEGTMAIRLPATMRLKGTVGQGHIVNSEGVRDGATWGKRAAWCDYVGPVNGKTLGVAIFDHPGNPRHPTWWHVRDYGLFAANPFGIHDFERSPDKHLGDLRLPAGESITFRYRFLFHEGDTVQGKVANRYSEYSKTGGS
ncbi:MAG: PmoA family protein [Verrucomicrobia bacterium]|nr:PmoA family protein [Verrucomicrobiota bacterium]